MAVKFSMTRDINGYNGFGLMPSDIMWNGVLVSGVEQTITIPSSPYASYPNLVTIFSFAPGSSIWVAYNKTSTPPTSTIALGDIELNPTARSVNEGDIIHFSTNDASNEYGVILYVY